MDTRWLYWDPETKLLGEKSPDYWPHVPFAIHTLSVQQKARAEWVGAQVVSAIACLDLIDRGSSNFPLFLADETTGLARPNLSKSVLDFLNSRSLEPATGFLHIVACLHAPAYRTENADALRMDWPRIPLSGDAATLRTSADLGGKLCQFLDSESQAPGVTTGTLRTGLKTLGLPTKGISGSIESDDLALTVGWGSNQTTGSGGCIVMPGRGLLTSRDYTATERLALIAEGAALGLSEYETFALLGPATFNVHLSANVWWSNVPANVWNYTLGGYQVIKKWLSYREKEVLGRPLSPQEAAHVSGMVRRIAAILLMGPALNANYEAAKATTIAWEGGRPVIPSSPEVITVP